LQLLFLFLSRFASAAAAIAAEAVAAAELVAMAFGANVITADQTILRPTAIAVSAVAEVAAPNIIAVVAADPSACPCLCP
jgi:hypothetical protein